MHFLLMNTSRLKGMMRLMKRRRTTRRATGAATILRGVGSKLRGRAAVLLAALAVAGAPGLALAPTAWADATVTDQQGLRDAIAAAPADGSETVVTVAGDLTLDGSIQLAAGQNVRLVDDGTARTIHVAATAGSSAKFTAAAGSTLTISTSSADNGLLTFDGGSVSSTSLELIRSAGAVRWQGGTVRNINFGNTARRGLVTVSGTNASLTLDDGLFTANSGGYMGGVLNAEGGANVTMNGGEVSGNTCDFYTTDGSPIYISARGSSAASPTRFTMNGGTVSGNVGGCGGGIFIGNGMTDQGSSAGGLAVGVINGGTISGNRTNWLGGGVAVMMYADLTLNGGTISNNRAVALPVGSDSIPEATGGGGVGVWDYWVGAYDRAYANAGYSASQIRAVWESTWSKQAVARFTMNGGVIDGNSSEGRNGDLGVGGGIYAGSGAVTLKAGTISNNTANMQGGGIYVPAVPYVAYLTRTVVTGNAADSIGGGIWSCPTGDVRVNLNNTAAVWGNTATGAGDDAASLVKSAGSYELNLSDRMLGGGRAVWYDDGALVQSAYDVLGTPVAGAARFADGGATAHDGAVTDTSTNLVLHDDTTEEGRAAATAAGSLMITGNRALRGGGIGTNGSVILGIEDEPVDVSVRKVWAESEVEGVTQPESVQVRLLRDGVWVDTAALDEANGWSHTFTGLPKHVDGDLDTDSVYTVEEVVPDGYTAEVTGDAASGFTVTNTPVPPTEPEKPEKPTEPEKPEKPETPSEQPKKPKGKKRLPKTGDAAAMASLGLAAAAAASASVAFARRRQDR